MPGHDSAPGFQSIVVASMNAIVPAMLDDDVVVDLGRPLHFPIRKMVLQPHHRHLGKLRHRRAEPPLEVEIVVADVPQALGSARCGQPQFVQVLSDSLDLLEDRGFFRPAVGVVPVGAGAVHHIAIGDQDAGLDLLGDLEQRFEGYRAFSRPEMAVTEHDNVAVFHPYILDVLEHRTPRFFAAAHRLAHPLLDGIAAAVNSALVDPKQLGRLVRAVARPLPSLEKLFISDHVRTAF